MTKKLFKTFGLLGSTILLASCGTVSTYHAFESDEEMHRQSLPLALDKANIEWIEKSCPNGKFGFRAKDVIKVGDAYVISRIKCSNRSAGDDNHKTVMFVQS